MTAPRSFSQRCTDALNGTEPKSASNHLMDVIPLVQEAARRCDPGDTNIDALVRWIQGIAGLANTGPDSVTSQVVADCERIAELLWQAFGDPP